MESENLPITFMKIYHITTAVLSSLLITLASPATAQNLQAQLMAAMCKGNWTGAIQTVDRIIKTIPKNQQKEWLDYRKSLVALQKSGNKTYRPPECPQTTTPTNAPTNTQRTYRSGSFDIAVLGTRTASGDEYTQPKDGHTWLIVNLSIRNNSQTPQYYFSEGAFQLKDASGTYYEESIPPESKRLPNAKIGTGKTVTGEIAYEVPTGTRGFTLEYDPHSPAGKPLAFPIN